jgi:hypothetical protein
MACREKAPIVTTHRLRQTHEKTGCTGKQETEALEKAKTSDKTTINS